MSNFQDFLSQGYEVIRELGRNREGGRVVYLAQKSGEPSQKVVIKQFQFAKGGGWSDFKPIEREMQVLEGLNHKGIPKYLGMFETDDSYCILQEYKNAKTLAEPRTFDFDQVKQIAISILEILIYLQKRNQPIIHRDIKPENILVDDELNVYLIDFGFARIGGGEIATSSVFGAGTFGFMPPEQIYNKGLSEATDLYGLGATLIALLTGTKSIVMDTLIDEGKINFKHLVPKLSLRFIGWLEKMVEPKLKDRYPNAETALKELLPLYVIRYPSVEISPSSLNFVATRLGEKITQTITITNSTPETILVGEWSVKPHPNDPPHSPDSHAWISFSPKEIKENNSEVKVTVDTSKLIAQGDGGRELLFISNAISDELIKIKVTTAPLPLEVKRLPNTEIVLLASSVVIAILVNYFSKDIAYGLSNVDIVANSLGRTLSWEQLARGVMSIPVVAIIWGIAGLLISAISMSEGNGFIAGAMWGGGMTICYFLVITIAKLIPIFSTFNILKVLAVFTLITFTIFISKGNRFYSAFLTFLAVIFGAGLGLNAVLFTNLSMMVGTILSGCILAFTLIHPYWKFYREISNYRNLEQHLIKP